MGHGKPPYAAEYRQQMVELVRAGRKPRDLAREFECSATTIRGWVRQADLDEGLREDGLTTVERDELRLSMASENYMHTSEKRAGTGLTPFGWFRRGERAWRSQRDFLDEWKQGGQHGRTCPGGSNRQLSGGSRPR